ncbi:EamA-like transporter family protein [compost metagenome]
MTLFIGIVLVLINSSAQIFLKLGATDSKIRIKLISISGYTIIGYVLFLVSTVLSIFMLKLIEFKSFTLILSFNYVSALIFSNIFLGERFTRSKIIATGLIIIGVIVFNL